VSPHDLLQKMMKEFVNFLGGFCRKVQAETSGIVTSYDLRSQGIELFRWRLGWVSVGHQLPLTNGVHHFHANDRTAHRR
jgi:hypothetical protein